MIAAAARPDLLACAATALVFGVAATGLAPRLASPWIRRGGWSWPTRLGVGAATATAAGLLTWLHAPRQPEQYALLAAWLTFVTAGVLLAAIDLSLRRLPTPIIVTASAAVTLALAVAAVLAKRPDIVVTPLAAAIAVGGGYVLLAVTGASSMGMGDVRLAALGGLVLGTAGWQTVLIGTVTPYLLAAPFALATIRRHARGTAPPIPFGPFLVSGTVLAGILAVLQV